MGSSSPSPSPAPPRSSAPARGVSNGSLRWGILRRALLAHSSSSRASEETNNDQQNKEKPSLAFIFWLCFSLKPSEEVLAFYSINHSDMFRSKRVLELGSGYGLAGLVIAASTNADEVVISDGNPQVVGYVQQNISMNAEIFGETKVKPMILHWDQEQASEMLNSFDIIVASDCTFFKQFHQSLAWVVKSLLKHSKTSQAIFLNPKRGDSLNKFLEIIKEYGLCFELMENYDPTVWNLHKKYVTGDDRSWPNYNEEHCYPLLVRMNVFSE